MAEQPKSYRMLGGPAGSPVFGMLGRIKRNPFHVLMENATQYGDVIPFKIAGRDAVQVNHPDLVRHVLMTNHKNYRKSKGYIRFEAAIGQGLLTSNGEKWRRDRQKIQPMFKKEQIEGYYSRIVGEVAEKTKQRWLELTKNGPAEIDVSAEMANITIQIILKIIYGKDNLDDKMIGEIQHAYGVFLEYLKTPNLFPKVDLRRIFRTPANTEFRAALAKLDGILRPLLERYKRGELADTSSMIALLLEAQRQDPEHFSEEDILEHCATMVFAGFETTSIAMHWMWFVLDGRPDVQAKLRDDIANHTQLQDMQYLGAVFRETMRLYPPIWITSREPIEEDVIGGHRVLPGATIMLPQIVMQRHPHWWDEPNAFMPERFLGEAEDAIDEGLYFPFSHGARKCSGYKLAEMEAKAIFVALFPLFKVSSLNVIGNRYHPGITLKFLHPLKAKLSRV